MLALVLLVLFGGCAEGFFYPKPTGPDIYTGKVVGVLTQETHGFMERLGDEYLAASYIKFVQSAGVQTIPILTTWKDDYITNALSQINGVLVPGGNQYIPNSRFYEVVRLIYNWAEGYNSNRTDGYFPIWGTCLGFQSILTAAANDSIETNCTAEGPNNLTLLDGAQESKLLSGVTAELYKAIQTDPLIFNSHHHCIPVSSFSQDTISSPPRPSGSLSGKFNLLAVNWDDKGYKYAALAEHTKHPYFVSQFHPEKVGYEWDPYLPIPHSRNAVLFMQYLVNTYVGHVRKNGNKFKSPTDFYKMSIENVDSKYTLRLYNATLQTCYFFRKGELEDVFYVF